MEQNKELRVKQTEREFLTFYEQKVRQLEGDTRKDE